MLLFDRMGETFNNNVKRFFFSTLKNLNNSIFKEMRKKNEVKYWQIFTLFPIILNILFVLFCFSFLFVCLFFFYFFCAFVAENLGKRVIAFIFWIGQILRTLPTLLYKTELKNGCYNLNQTIKWICIWDTIIWSFFLLFFFAS